MSHVADLVQHARAAAALGCSLLLANQALAQKPFIEAEPNNTPETATEFRAPATLMGDMPGGDQDAWLWTVSDADAGRFWTLELKGLPGRLTIADIGHVRYDESGNLAGFDRLVKIGSRDGAQPAVFDRLIFEPGEFLIGMARSGGAARFRPAADSLAFGEAVAEIGAESTTNTDAYRLVFRSDERVPASLGSSATSQDAATPLESGSEVAGYIESDAAVWYRLDIPEDKADARWDFHVLVPVGRSVEATFRDAEGTRLASARNDSQGRLTISGISRPAGSWFVDVRPILAAGEAPGFVQLITVTESGQRVAGEESEPNDQWQFANRADSLDCCTGEIGKRNDYDRFAYTLGESDNLRALVVENSSGNSITACLLDERGSSIQCRTGTDTVRIPNLLLPAGEYGVYVSGATVGTGYSIAFEEEGPPEPGREVEPNDAAARAIGAPENNRIRGSFDSDRDVDYFRFVLSGEPQLWRLQAIGDGIGSLTYHDIEGIQRQSVTAGGGQRRLRLDNLFLFPGTHLFSISGSGAGDYTLLARALGPPNPDSELEPNDDSSRRMPLRIGQTRIGILSEASDIDQYRFHLADHDHIRLTATPPADGSLTAKLYLNGDIIGTARWIDGPIRIEGVFPPGDYQLSLEPREPSDAEYTLALERLDRFACGADCEPNNYPIFASAMPASRVVEGTVGDWEDGDWFRLPALEAEQPVRLTIESESGLAVRLYDRQMNRLNLQADRATSTYSGTLPAGDAGYLHLAASRPRPYRLIMLLGDETEPPPAVPALDASATLGFSAETVTAYARFGQRVEGELTLTNNGSEPLSLKLDSSTSDMAWTVEPERDEIALPAGATESVGVMAIVPVDARADKPVRIGLRARSVDGRFISVSADVTVDADADPVGPGRAWSIPDALRGGLNVAHRRYGATLSAVPVPSGDAEGSMQALIDGRSSPGYGAAFNARRDGPLELTIDLAGEGPIPIAGFALNPMGRMPINFAPVDAVLQLSTDGSTFETVASGSVVPVGTDQYTTLDAPVPATHARVLLEGTWTGETGRRLTLGEVKVIAEPGIAPTGVGPVNIADPDNGGHVVWSNPAIGARWDVAILTEENDASPYDVAEGQQPEWVVGFHNNRAAEIERIVWRETDDDNTKLTNLTLSVSRDSPVGPWQELAEWNRLEAGNELKLDTPTWARFLKFSAAVDEAEWFRADPPEQLAVFERATGEDYRSVVSEWGFRSRSGWYEATQPLGVAESYADRGNRSAASADPLQGGVTEVGTVRLGKVSHWYRPVLPEGHNAMRFVLTGDPTVRTELALTDTSGEPIVLRKMTFESTLQSHVFEAWVKEGQTPVLEVREPPRNVLFLWDTSGSLEPFVPMIQNSVTTYAEDLVPGQDMANLQPFGAGGPILDRWFGEPYLMQMVLNDYRSTSDNSAAENNQRTATMALANRPGTKAIVMITDAETPREPRVWDEFERVKPRVFTMNVGESEQSQDLMQDWASVNDGHYAFVQQDGEMEIAFERVSAMLRKPAGYTLSMTTEAREAPGPGFLRVVSGEDGPARGAVELILDASGSMLQRMEGRRRIDIAKEVLTMAIREQIPEGTPTALRVFGHRTPNACETDLEIPLGPLEVEAAANRIAGIEAKNLARTPIADSLAAVMQDLRDSSGPALVVLVTDGEETCDGDPAAVIADLGASGIDVSLNIVGFGIKNQVIAKQFSEWAEAGGGQYFDSDNQDSLTSSIASALNTRFRVLDLSSTEVAEGNINAAPVALPQGRYRIIVNTIPATARDVEIQPESVTEIELSE